MRNGEFGIWNAKFQIPNSRFSIPDWAGTTGAPYGSSRRLGDAREVQSVVRAAGALPARDLRIEAQGPRAIGFSAGRVRRDDAVGRDALFGPLLERGEHVELVRSRAAAAVAHPRREEEPIELARLVEAAHRLHHGVVVRNGVLRRDDRVGPAGV